MTFGIHRFEVRRSGSRIEVAEVSAASIGLNESGKPQTEPVILRRAMEAKSPLFAWWKDSVASPRKRPTVQISLLGSNGKPALGWTLQQTQAIRWSAPALDALHPAIALEELHIAYSSIELTTF